MTVKNYFLLCPVIYISLLLVSCANDTKAKLIGKWQLIRDSISCDNPQIDSLEAAAKGKIQSPQASLVLEAGREVQEGETLVFSKDDSYEQSVGKIALPGKI